MDRHSIVLASLAVAIAVLAACSSETTPQHTSPTMGPWGGSGGSGAAAGTGGVGATGAGGVGATGAGGQGATGAGGGTCPDIGIGEWNQTEITAYQLDVVPITDCDEDGGVLSGVIAGPDDVDWFFYRGDDIGTCEVDPTVFFNTADPGIRICAFLECVAGDTALPECLDGSSATSSPSGRPGCCNQTGFTMGSVSCSGSLDDDSYVYMRVDHPGAPADTCDSYVLSYHF